MTAIAPELFSAPDAADVDAALMLTRGLRRAPENLQLVLPAGAGAPAAARRAIADLARSAGANVRELDVIRTVVSEAVTNVVRHAYDESAGEARGMVYVDAAVIDGDLTIVVVDDGHGPRVASADPGLGLGWKLLAQMTDRWAVVQRGEGGTLVCMRLSLGAGEPAPDA